MPRFRARCLSLLCRVALCAGFALIAADAPVAAAQVSSDDTAIEIVDMAVGFEGHVLLGQWTPVRVELSQTISSPWQLEVATLDGDAVPIRYLTSQAAPDRPTQSLQGLIRVGRASGLRVQVFDATPSVRRPLAERSWTLSEFNRNHRYLPSTSFFALAVGTDQLPTSPGELAGPESNEDAHFVVTQPRELPSHWLGYESVRVIFLSTQNVEQLSQITTAQREAMLQWIRMGGRIFISSGRQAAAIFGEGGALAELAPGQFDLVESTRDTGAIEIFVNSNDPLVTSGGPSLAYAVFAENLPNVPLRIEGHPVLTHRLFEFGLVSFLALDVADEPLRSWPGRGKLISRAMMHAPTSESDTVDARSGRVTHMGYEDFTGQLRSAMDRFNNVAFVTFTSVAILIGIFVLAVAPGDYLFLQRFVKRMEWTWLTFLFVAAAFCVLAMLAVNWAKSDSLEVNQVEVIDVDASSSLVRGTLWAQLYSPRTETYDVQMAEANRAIGAIQQPVMVWQGLPGSGLGGMQFRADLGLYRRDYECRMVFDSGQLESTMLWKVPLQSASSKSLLGRWTGQLDRPAASQLRQNPNTDAVLGTFTNPLPVSLTNCVLLYGGWAYVLDRTLEANETIDVESELREKTIRGFYTRRRQQSGDDDVNAPWDPADTSVSRIVNAMMFYQAIGGERYTKLTHAYQSYLDLSGHLQLGRAVMVGQRFDVAMDLEINGQPANDHYDKTFTFVRVVFPVQPRAQRN